MINRLSIIIFLPIVFLMILLGALLYFGVLRTVDDFARQNIESDLEYLTHDLFNVVDQQFMQAIKAGKIDDEVALRISQVDCLDILERNTYARRFKLVVYEVETGMIRLMSESMFRSLGPIPSMGAMIPPKTWYKPKY